MALCVSGEHFIPNFQFRRRRTTTTPIVRASSLLDDHSDHHCLRRPSVLKYCSKKKKNYNHLFFFCCCCGKNPSSNPKPSSSSSSSAPKKSKNLKTLLLGLSSASAATALIIYNNISSNNSGGGNGGGWNRGGGGGGGDGNGGDGFWSRFFSLSAAIDKELEEEEEVQLAEKDISDHHDDLISCSSSPAGKNQEWVVFHHGLIPAINMNIVFDQVFKKLMISTGLIKVTKTIHWFDQYPWSNIINDSSCSSLLGVIEMLMPAVRSGHEIYNRQGGQVAVRHQLSEALWNSGGILIWFPDYKKPLWKSPESFRCISVGSLPEWGPFIDPDDHKIFTSTDHREKLEYYQSLARAYKMRMDKAGPCLIPLAVQNEIFMKLKEGGKEVISPTTRSHLFKIMEDRVIKWYHDRSYACAYVVFFGESICNAKEIVCEVFEGNITRLDIQFIDKLNNVCEEGNTQLALIKRQLPKVLQQGHLYHYEAAKKAIINLNSLGLFSSIEMIPRSDKKNVGEIVLEIKLKEYERNKSEVTTTWDIVPAAGQERRPTLASLQPSVIVTYVHRNLKGLNRSIIGSIASPNLLNPQTGDLQLEFEYVHPYLDGVNDPRDRTFHINFYPTYGRKSPVFPGIPELFWIPPILVDRAGIKTYITENFNNHQNKFMYGLVMEMITTSRIQYLNDRHYITNGVDYYGPPTTHSGMGFECHGPPTTLSGTGVDYRVVAQANIIRDNTKFVNGMTVGQRTMFQLDQGLGIGSKFPFFNRHQLTHTRFLQLKQVEEGAGKPVPPPVLVLHGHYGGCVGDLPGYDAFTLGGPNSVRGYSQGELGACRYMLEVAAELRIPVKNNTYVYAFAEHGNDLGSSKDVRGNPTQYYRRKGQGSSYGLGVKLMGQVRAEYAIDHNEGKGALFIQFGERF